MKEIILGILLGIQGSIDLKNKEIPLWVSLLGAVVGIGFCVKEGRDPTEMILACVPGMMALLFSKISNEAIGYGDSILILVMGMYMTIGELVSVGMLAFGIAGVVALVLLVIFRKNGRYEIPFVPFLCLAYVIENAISLGDVVL